MRISDWSSDVCSSDLRRLHPTLWPCFVTIIAHSNRRKGLSCRQMLVDQRRPRMHLIVIHGHVGSDAEIGEVQMLRGQNGIDVLEHGIKIVIGNSGLRL